MTRIVGIVMLILGTLALFTGHLGIWWGDSPQGPFARLVGVLYVIVGQRLVWSPNRQRPLDRS